MEPWWIQCVDIGGAVLVLGVELSDDSPINSLRLDFTWRLLVSDHKTLGCRVMSTLIGLAQV